MALIASDKCRASFSELFDFYAPRVKSYMLRLGASALEAEDLAQDVMVTVWRKAGMYDRKQASVSTWIFRVARNRRIDKFRRASRPDLDADEPMLRPPDIEQPDAALDQLHQLGPNSSNCCRPPSMRACRIPKSPQNSTCPWER